MARPLLPQSPLGLSSVYVLSQPGGSSFISPANTPSQPADVEIWNNEIMLQKNVSKLNKSSIPAVCLTCMKKFIPKIANMNITRNRSSPMLNNAGMDTARENSKVRIPLADLTSRKMRPTLKIRTTRNRVGDTKYFLMISAKNRPGKQNTKVQLLLTNKK